MFLSSPSKSDSEPALSILFQSDTELDSGAAPKTPFKAELRQGESHRAVVLERLPVASFFHAWVRQYSIPAFIAALMTAAIFIAPYETAPTPPHEGLMPKTAILTLSSGQGDSWSVAASTSTSVSAREAQSAIAASPLTERELTAIADDALAEIVPTSTDLKAWAGQILTVARCEVRGGGAQGGSGSGASFGGEISTDGFTSAFGLGGSLQKSGGSGFAAPRVMVTFMPSPHYPEIARREKRQGAVEIKVMVDAAGRANVATIATTSGHADLDEAARLTVLQQWRFRYGNPSDASALRECIVRVSFSLDRH